MIFFYIPIAIIAAIIFSICVNIYKVTEFVCSNWIACSIVACIIVAVIVFIICKSYKKRNMPCYIAATAITLFVPLIDTAIIIIPTIMLDDALNTFLVVVFSIAIFCGGANFTLVINQSFDSGAKCLISSLIFLLISAVIIAFLSEFQRDYLTMIQLSGFTPPNRKIKIYTKNHSLTDKYRRE